MSTIGDAISDVNTVLNELDRDLPERKDHARHNTKFLQDKQCTPYLRRNYLPDLQRGNHTQHESNPKQITTPARHTFQRRFCQSVVQPQSWDSPPLPCCKTDPILKFPTESRLSTLREIFDSSSSLDFRELTESRTTRLWIFLTDSHQTMHQALSLL